MSKLYSSFPHGFELNDSRFYLQFSSFGKEEYPQGEVVGEYIILSFTKKQEQTLFLLPPRPLGTPSSRKEGSFEILPTFQLAQFQVLLTFVPSLFFFIIEKMVFIFHRMGSSFAVYSVISRKIVLKFSLTSCIFAFSYRESRNKTPISLVVHGREQV